MNAKPIHEETIDQTAAFANLLSAACALPVVSKTVAICNSYTPILALSDAAHLLFEQEKCSAAFELVQAWLRLTEQPTSEILSGISPNSALAKIFVCEFLCDIEEILSEEFGDSEYTRNTPDEIEAGGAAE